MSNKHKELRAIQSNALIRSSQGNLTLTQKRILLYLISQIKPEDTELKYYEIGVSDFARMVETSICENETQTCMKAIDDFMKLPPMKFQIDDKIITTRWVLKSVYHIGQGTFSILLDEDLKPALLELKSHFTSIYLKQVMGIRSIHGVRLAEILSSYLNHNKEKGVFITTPDELRNMLSLENKYPTWGQLKNKIILPMTKLIGAKTDIKVTKIDERKRGRSVVSVTFFLRRKPVAIPTEETQEKEQLLLDNNDSAIIAKVRAHGVNPYNKKTKHISEDAWRIALEKHNQNDPSNFLVASAETIQRRQDNLNKIELEKMNESNRIEFHKKWTQEHSEILTSKGFHIYLNDPYIRKPNNSILKYIEKDFIEKCSKYL